MNKTKKIVSLIILLVLLFFVFVSGYTFAKYMTEVEGGGIGNIAKWSFKSDGENSSINTIKLGETVDSATLVNNKIAPGSKGKFDIVIDATGSEVDVVYDANIQSEVNKPTNMKFRLKEDNEIFQDLSSLVENKVEGTILATDSNQKIVYTIEWEWPYSTENGDEIDTQEGISAQAYEFNIQVVGQQKNNI